MKKIPAALLALVSATAIAASSFTANYNLEKPQDGSTSWGTAIRDSFDKIDAQMKINSTSSVGHIADPTAAHLATAISTVPGTVCDASVNVQTYLACLDAQFDNIVGGLSVTLADAQTITGQKTFTAQILANAGVQGDLLGNVTGNTAGTHTGAVVGNVTGDLVGNSNGTHTGAVIGNVTGNLTGNSAGIHTGDVTGNLTGNSAGTHTGAVIGNVTGNLTGNSAGVHTGAVTGNVTGDITGNITPTGATSSRAAIVDGTGKLTSTAVTTTELGYVAGVSSAIQTQINSKQATGSYLTALTGDVAASGPGSATATIQSGVIDNAKVSSSAAIARSKLAAGSLSHVVINDGAGAFSSEATLAKVRGGTGADNSAVTFPSTGVITTDAATSTLTNKTLTTPTVDVPLYTQQATTPAAPASGSTKIYAKTDGKVYKLNNAGGEVEIGAGSGGTTVNYAPYFDTLTSGPGTFNMRYSFVVSSGNVTAGATYTNNGVTFTAMQTIAAGTQIVMSGSGAPAASGTLTKSAGTGDSTLTFSTFKAPLYLELKVVGGGAGGAGSGTGAGTSAVDGGSSTWGSTLLVAGGGSKSAGTATGGGNGGTNSFTAGPVIIGNLPGGFGGGGQLAAGSGNGETGGDGGVGTLGGNGSSGSVSATTGTAAAANSGAGGGGAGAYGTANVYSGSGGGAGGTLLAAIYSPSSSYAYTIGSGGAGGGAGGSGSAGGNGGTGVIMVKTFFQ